ncbi:MAG: hypothetical protein ACXVWU_10925 [Nocardioides sp.]
MIIRHHRRPQRLAALAAGALAAGLLLGQVPSADAAVLSHTHPTHGTHGTGHHPHPGHPTQGGKLTGAIRGASHRLGAYAKHVARLQDKVSGSSIDAPDLSLLSTALLADASRIAADQDALAAATDRAGVRDLGRDGNVALRTAIRQASLTRAVSRARAHADSLSTQATDLQAGLDSAAAAGQDTSADQALIADATTQLATVGPALDQAIGDFFAADVSTGANLDAAATALRAALRGVQSTLAAAGTDLESVSTDLAG